MNDLEQEILNKALLELGEKYLSETGLEFEALTGLVQVIVQEIEFEGDISRLERFLSRYAGKDFKRSDTMIYGGDFVAVRYGGSSYFFEIVREELQKKIKDRPGIK